VHFSVFLILGFDVFSTLTLILSYIEFNDLFLFLYVNACDYLFPVSQFFCHASAKHSVQGLYRKISKSQATGIKGVKVPLIC